MDKKYSNDELANWFREKAMSARSGAARNRILGADERYSDPDREFVGNMYFFRYDPKHKMTLSKYDKYPLAIVVERYTDGFLGLNMHYLSVRQRKSAFRMVGEFKEKKKPNTAPSTGRGVTNWELLINFNNAVEPLAKESVHRYLYSHVRSQFIRINPDEYDKAVQLPIDEWVYKR